MKCNQCGTENEVGSRYCRTCGALLDSVNQEQTFFQSEPQEPKVEPAPVQTRVEPTPTPAPTRMPQQEIGNGIACMVLGIVSIVFGCTPLVGLVCGIIAIIMNQKDAKQGIQTSYHKAGNICGIIGVCLGGISLVYWVICFGAAMCTAVVAPF